MMAQKPVKSVLQSTLIVGVFAFSPHHIALANTAECIDSNTLICITETNTNETVTIGAEQVYLSQYSVTNNSEDRVYGFAVTNSVGLGADNLDQPAGWEAATLSTARWESPSEYFTFNNGMRKWLSGPFDFGGGKHLGGFDELFVGDGAESVADNVNFYWNYGTSDNPLNSGATLSGFNFYGLPESSFAAFDANGDIIAASITTSVVDLGVLPDPGTNVSAVPEPETYLLFLAGLGILSMTNRRLRHIEYCESPLKV